MSLSRLSAFVSGILLAITLIWSAATGAAQSVETPGLEQVLSENAALRERLHALEARRQAFRWSRFPQGPVLRSGTVLQAVLAADGRLAFCTDGQGLVFYDGTRVEVVDSRSGLPDNFVTAITLLDSATAWVGTGSGLALYHNGTVSIPDDLPDRLRAAPISAILRDNAGGLWVGTQGHGLWSAEADAWEHWPIGPDSLTPGLENINGLAQDPSGNGIWVATAGGGVCCLRGGVWERYPDPLGPGSEEVYCLATDRDGLLWIGTAEAGAGFWDGIKWRRVELPFGQNCGVPGLTLLESGDLFFGTTDGAFVYHRNDGAWERIPLPEELASYPVVTAVEAHGALWLSPSGQGLHVLDLTLIQRYGLEQGLPDLEVYRIAQAPDNRLWCATRNGAARLDGQRWSVPPETAGLPDRLVTCIVFGPSGTTYFGTYSGLAIIEHGVCRVLDRDSGLSSNTINHLALDSLGVLLISTEGGGLGLYAGDSLRVLHVDDGLPSEQVQAVLPTGDHTVWAATRKGLARWDGSGFQPPVAGRDGIAPSVGLFTSLCLAADGSMWAATYDQGAWQLRPDGTWVHHTVDQGLGSNEVYSVTPASQGRLAFGTAQGLSLYDGARWRSFGPADGLSAGAVRDIHTARDSSLWLALQEQGVLRFDPDRFPPPETWIRTPTGCLTALDIRNERLYYAPSSDSLHHSPGDSATSRSRFYLDGAWYEPSFSTGLDSLSTDSLSLGLVAVTPWQPGESGPFRFSWKLDNGLWSDWLSQGSIGLSHLGRGAHILFVRAKGPRLNVDLTPASYAFHVEAPTIWSDWRIYALAASLVLLVLGLWKRRQVVWLLRRLARRSFRLIEPNPFHPNRPAGSSDFRGRENQLASLDELRRPPSNASVIVHGPEKTGVTSFLQQAAHRAESLGATAVRLDMAGHWFADMRSLLSHLEGLLTPTDTTSETQGTPESLLAAVRTHGGELLILIDNAEYMTRLAAHDSDTAARLAAALREMVLGESGASLVFGLHDPEALRERLAPVYEMSRLLELGSLSREDSRAVLVGTLADNAVIHHEALDYLAALCAGQPFLLHCLGRETVELMNHERTNFLDRELAALAVERLLESPPTLFPDRWDELSRTEKLLLSAAVTVSGSPGANHEPRTSDIAGILRTQRITILEEELSKAASALAAGGLVTFEPASGRIDPGETLFSLWVRAHQPVEAVSAREDYDPGEVLRRAGEAAAQSFRAGELVENVLAALQSGLRFDWAAYLPLEGLPDNQTGEPVRIGSGWPVEMALNALPSGLAQQLTAAPGSLFTAEEQETQVSGAFGPGALAIPVLLRGEPAGAFVFGPRQDSARWSRRDRNLLQTVADQTAVSLENVRLYEQETERERLKQELDTARRMQMAILPKRSLSLPGLEIFAFISPATEVGGDYFDYRRLEDGCVAFVIGDVSGHGVSAGTLVSMTKSCLFNQFRVDWSVTAVLQAMNDMVCGALSERLLMTFCYGIFETEQHRLRYSIAGHPFPYHLRCDGELKELEMSAYPLGVSGKAKYQEASLEYSPGDVLVFYSDGIVEGVNPEGEQYGFGRFEASIRRHSGRSSEKINDGIIRDFREFSRGIPQGDDITLVVIRMI